MKILGLILAVLMLAGTAFIDLTAANKAHKAATDIAKVNEMLGDSGMKGMKGASKELGDLPSPGRLNAGAGLCVIGGLGAIVLLISAFAKKQWVKAIAGATVGATALAAIIYPYVPTGPLEGMAPRPQALLGLVLAVIGAGGALLASRQKV